MEMQKLVRKKIRESGDPQKVAASLSVSIRTVYRHIEGMDLEMIRILNLLPEDRKKNTLRDMASMNPDGLVQAYGVTRQYVDQLLSGSTHGS